MVEVAVFVEDPSAGHHAHRGKRSRLREAPRRCPSLRTAGECRKSSEDSTAIIASSLRASVSLQDDAVDVEEA